MTERKRRWTVRLTVTAARDFEQIIDWTIERFGEPQALAYSETLSLAQLLRTAFECPQTYLKHFTLCPNPDGNRVSV